MKTYYAIWSKMTGYWLLDGECLKGNEIIFIEYGVIRKINQVWIWDNKESIKDYASTHFWCKDNYEIREFTTQDALLERCRKG